LVSGDVIGLIVRAAAVYSGAVGFGDVYSCQVHEIVTGALGQGAFQLTILAKDSDRAAFLAAHPAPEIVELAFRFDRSGEAYGLRPFTGFVDAERNSWVLASMRAVTA
jgi:hypothetical protein